eukprot:scaffold674977_cov73-Prasinocladus_malaysianus.AAC.1
MCQTKPKLLEIALVSCHARSAISGSLGKDCIRIAAGWSHAKPACHARYFGLGMKALFGAGLAQSKNVSCESGCFILGSHSKQPNLSIYHPLISQESQTQTTGHLDLFI